jgi:dihydrofolate reductase
MRISFVVAASDNGVIGVGNQLPWRLPEDLKRFKALTMGKPVLMGRKTFDSIGRVLPGRRNIVVTRRTALAAVGVTAVHSIDAALAAAGDAQEVMVIGGAEIYAQLLASTQTIHLTRVHTSIAGDAFLPALAPHEWREVDSEPHAADDRHAFPFTFITLERVAP